MILCIKHSTAMRIKILGRVPGTATFEPLDEDETDDGLLAALGEEVPGVLIVRIRDVALTFANTGPMKERLRRLERYGHGRHHPAEEPRRAEASVVIFDLSDVNEVDASALVILLEIVEAYSLRSVLVCPESLSFRGPFADRSCSIRRCSGPSATRRCSLACVRPA